VQKGCQARNLNREDAMERSRWKKLIKIGWLVGWLEFNVPFQHSDKDWMMIKMVGG